VEEVRASAETLVYDLIDPLQSFGTFNNPPQSGGKPTVIPERQVNLSPLGALLRTKHVPRFLLAALVSRLATGMFALSIMMTVLHDGGAHFMAGAALSSHARPILPNATFANGWP
jgi:hypothetical protein